MSDTISCDCGNKFKVFESAKRHRLISCIKCMKQWSIGCSGRRLYGMRMIKLFVDDLRQEPKGWHRVTTVTEAIRMLSQGYVSEISIDHDIQCQIKENGSWHESPETFYPVAQYLALMPKDERPKIRIHTSNFPMGERMAELLEIPYYNYIYDPKDYETNE